jgi:hypothetical protein
VTLLEAALQYAAAGFRVFPLHPREKQPLGALAPHGVKDATADIPQVVAWWSKVPDANIGVATGGGRWVLDLDDYDARARLEAAGVLIPEGAPAATTGKGAHIWFAGDVRNRTKLVDKVDVRGDGGYVVAPPSIHPSGATYQWVGEPPFGRPLPPPPPALLAMVGNTAKVSSSGTSAAGASNKWVADLMAGVGEGGRDDACTRLAGYYLGKGLPVEVVLQILASWAESCQPPFPFADVEKCVASIAAREGAAAPSGVPWSVADVVDDALKLIQSPVRNARTTGIAWLDTALDGGFEPGTTTLIGGRPGTGKTALKLQIGRHAAATGTGVLFVTLEMSAPRLVRRMLSQVSQVPFASLKTGDLIAGQRTNLLAAADALRALPFWIETRVRTVEAIDEVLGAYEAGQVGLVMIDYLQKLRAPESRLESRARVEHVSEALTKLAVARNLPLVVASSLSRPDRAASNWRPTLASLRESGQLEFDADNVVLLYRDEGSPALEVNIAKQRDGATSQGLLFFKAETLTFTEGN